MSIKEKIIAILKNKVAMTQRNLAFEIYGDYNHSPYIYNSLSKLVTSGDVIRSGSFPSVYSIPVIIVSRKNKTFKTIEEKINNEIIESVYHSYEH